jgi:hypothetical protein
MPRRASDRRRLRPGQRLDGQRLDFVDELDVLYRLDVYHQLDVDDELRDHGLDGKRIGRIGRGRSTGS